MAILTARDAADLLAEDFAGERGERLIALFLDNRGGSLGRLAWAGAGDSVHLPLRAIVAGALARDAAGLVIAHNHPGGDPRPSEADIAATRRLAMACAALDLTLHDHLIWAGGEWESLRRLGLL